MQFRLLEVQVTDLSFKKKTYAKDSSEESILSITLNSKASEEEKRLFAIEFVIELGNSEEDLHLALTAVAHFETTEDLHIEEFKESSFFKINAPAIAYPYVRAFVSNFILNSGYEPIILPTVNFVKLHEELNENKTENTSE